MKNKILSITEKYSSDPTRLMDIFWDIQEAYGHIPSKSLATLEKSLKISQADLRETLSFYHFFHTSEVGEYCIYLNKDVASQLSGHDLIYKAFETECGCKFGQVSEDGKFGLFETPCIGLSDQEPAALINLVPFTNLTSEKVKDIVAALRSGKNLSTLVAENGYGDGANEQIKTMVCSNIRQLGAVFGEEIAVGDGLAKALETDPESVVEEVKTSGVRGRGGAGFGAGMKWSFCRAAKGETKYIVCNADEGEPGTFKDRIVMTEYPDQLFEGMAIAGYAVGAQEGILYLRAEYKYMQEYLENKLANLRGKNILGDNVLGKSGFKFDIRIQFGAGAYVCGEESALLESMEGKRGTPRVKPPFPVEVGYLGCPTVINNVETLAAIPHILKNGGNWYKGFGTEQTPGTKLLSVSGDCEKPGIYEVEFGITVKEFLALVGAKDAYAVQVSGPSGECINAQNALDRKLCHEDLSAGGSMIIFNKDRDLLKYMHSFMQFFVEESCGICTPCRIGNVIMRNRLFRVCDGRAIPEDLKDLVSWGKIISDTARCGLGMTSSNPIVTTIKNFPELYQSVLDKNANPLYDQTFNLEKSVEAFDSALKEHNEIGRNVNG